MFKHAASFLPLLLVVSSGACSVGGTASEVTGSTDAPLTAQPPNMSILVGSTMMSFAYWASGPALTVTLVGPGGGSKVASLYPTAATQNQVAEFDGLSPCTEYTWSIQGPSGVAASGQTNTRLSGLSGLCPTSEAITATSTWAFQGLEHQEQNNLGCSGWTFPTWPVDTGWTTVALNAGGSQGGYDSVQFGYQHWSKGGFCAESTVHVWRSQLVYSIPPAQWARGVANATLTGTFAGSAAPCAGSTSTLREEVWGQKSDGAEWAPIMGSPETNAGVVQASPTLFYPIVTSGNQISVNFSKPSMATVIAGFESYEDGFGDPSEPSPSYAVDNNACVTRITGMALNLTYTPLAPETPINCNGTIVCGGATVQCSWSPDVFELHAAGPYGGDRIAQTKDLSGMVSVVALVDPLGTPSNSYSVCTVNASGARACAPVTITSATACVPVTIGGGGGGGGSSGGGVCPNGCGAGKPAKQ